MKEKEHKRISNHRLGIVGDKEVSYPHESERCESRRKKNHRIGISELNRSQNPEVSSFSGKKGRERGIASEKKAYNIVRELVKEGREEIPEGKEGSPFYEARDHEKSSKDEEGFLFHLFKDKEVW